MSVRVLVTGGAGFIGSHLCKRLVEEGCDVLCVDNYFTGTKQNVVSLQDYDNFELMRHDVTFPLYVEVDQIYNLACPASPVHYQFDPVQTTKTSVHGAINMLGLAKRTRAKILQASTSEVYGDPEEHPQTETYWGRVNPVGIRACYDEGKRCAETLFFDYQRQHGLAIKVARIFNTYGPNMHREDGRKHARNERDLDDRCERAADILIAELEIDEPDVCVGNTLDIVGADCANRDPGGDEVEDADGEDRNIGSPGDRFLGRFRLFRK